MRRQSVVFFLLLFWFLSASTIVRAEIEHARDLMEANEFEAAYKELWPAARSGNADAEELIGVMYAMGLGVRQDYQRAFDWYLRSALKGHPGAQSGVGWYYELGLGMLRRIWYALTCGTFCLPLVVILMLLSAKKKLLRK